MEKINGIPRINFVKGSARSQEDAEASMIGKASNLQIELDVKSFARLDRDRVVGIGNRLGVERVLVIILTILVRSLVGDEQGIAVTNRIGTRGRGLPNHPMVGWGGCGAKNPFGSLVGRRSENTTLKVAGVDRIIST